MKKVVSILICAVLLAALPAAFAAAAETDLTACSISSGTVQAVRFEDVTAPCSGTLLPFDWNVGDSVKAGQTLFRLMTSSVTAPDDGTVSCVFIESGQSADAAMAVYGSAMTIEPLNLERMHATYSGAPNEKDCRHVHVGQQLWFRHVGEEGTGRVIATYGKSYEVEILSGEYDVDDEISLYTDDSYDYHSRVGTGTVYKRDDIPIAGSGVVAEIPVSPGDSVKRGDTLFTLLSPDADIGAVPELNAPAAGVLSHVAAVSGQQVWKGQLLARLYRTDALEIVADVDEIDLNGLKVGDSVSVTLDTNEEEILTGTVTEISGLGVTRQNAAYYTVHIAVDSEGLMLGQSASVYLPRR